MGLRAELAPLKKKRLKLEAEINRVTFDLVLAPLVDTESASELDGINNLIWI